MADQAAQLSGRAVEVEVAAGTNSSRRNRKSTPMDAARLMRKRATDRRSQQAFRERTKLRIAALEDEVAKASQATKKVTQELHELALQHDNLGAECLKWKKKAMETSELQAQDNDQLRNRRSDHGLEISSAQQAMLTGASPALDMSPEDSNPDESTDNDPTVQTQARDDQEASAEVHSTTALLTPEVLLFSKAASGSSHETSKFARETCAAALPQPLCRDRSASFPTDSADYESVCFPISTGQTSPRHGAAEILQLISKDHLSIELSELYTGAGLGTHPGVTELTGDVSVVGPAQEPRTYASAEIQFQQPQANSPPYWQGGQNPIPSNQVDLCEQLPYNLKPVAPGDRILQALVASRRSAAAEGVPWDELLGPELPCWNSLIAPTPTSCGHIICQAVVDIVKAYTGYSGFPEKVASAYIMYTSVTWRMSLKRERFEKMPSWMRPRPIQSQVAHQAWIDRVPWPSVRELLVKDQELYHVEEFGVFHSTSVSVNWPYSSNCVLINASDDMMSEGDMNLKLNPAFEEHIRNLRNWTAGPRFTQRYSELATAVRQDITDGGNKD